MTPETLWDLDDDPDGNVQHIAEHGITKEDVDCAVATADRFEVSHSSGRPILFGFDLEGRRVAVIYAEVDDDTVYPVTAFYVEVE